MAAAPARVTDGRTALLQARPQLLRIATAGDALGLRDHELLHAGPPLTDPRDPPATLRSAIVMTCLHEGWATDATAAEALLTAGRLTLSPAQDHACATPLAAVISTGTPLFVVGDALGGAAPLHAPVSAVRGPDTRMGHRDPAVLARLQWRDGRIAPALAHALVHRGPIDLWPLAATGLAAGDDLHSRTTSANEAFVAVLRERGATELADDVAATPLFFLTLWMAACAFVLRAAEGSELSGLVTRAGGNGAHFAIALAGRPEHWVHCAAEPPVGTRLAHLAGDARIEGAIGDSAVIDMLGFGGQRLAHAPEPLGVFGAHLPPDAGAIAAQLLLAPHPLLADAWPIGLDASRVLAQCSPPWVTLAMLAADGETGFAGRGIYRPPLSLFEQALLELG